MSITKYLRINAMIVLIMAMNCNARAQNIVAAEYFFNTDPGPGNGTPISITAGTTITVNNLNIPSTSLSTGWHTLCVRTKDSNNVWGFYECRNIFIRSTPPGPPPLAPITAMEYFYDNVNDPGTGQTVAITSGTNVTVSGINLPQSLAQGWHTLHVRTQDQNNVWGFYETRSVYVRSTPVVPPLPAPITAMEYYYDNVNDPDTGLPVTITTGTNVNVSGINLPQTLAQGWHTLHVRSQDQNSMWGFYETRSVFVRSQPVVAPLPPNIVQFEYFVDTDPGVGLSVLTLTKPPSTLIDLPAEPLNIGSLSLGSHILGLRAKDQNGTWSTTEQRSFIVVSGCTAITAPTTTNATRCTPGTLTLTANGAIGSQTYRWYADNTTLVITSTGSPFTTPSLSANTDYYVSIYDPTTFCESSRTKASAIVTGIPKPTLNLTGSLTVCQGNMVVLQAPVGFSSYTWSNGLTTPQITVATSGSYTVTVGNGTCFSPSSDPFTFTVNPNPAKPTVNATGGGSLCGTGSVTLSAPVGFSSYAWSSGQTTADITVTSAGNFSVSVTNASGCQSVASDAFAVTATTLAKPVITITGNTALCDSGSVTLDAPSGFSGYSWSNGSTAPQVTVSTAGNYTVTVTNGSCTSAASDVVTVSSVARPAQPSITVLGNTALCTNSFVVLTAPAGFSHYVWSNGGTSRQVVIDAPGTYSVQTGNAANCLSIVSSGVTVTTTGQPCGGGGTPGNALATTASRCGPGTVTLGASGAGNNQEYRWYDVPSGGLVLSTVSTFTTPSINTTTYFYVSIFDTQALTEGSRVIATATVVNLTKPVVSPTGILAICQGSSTLLSAPSGFTNYLWSNGATTQQLPLSIAGTYSVQTGDGTCWSEPSDEVSLTVSPALGKPGISVTGNTVLCDNSSVVITAPAGFTSYSWSNGLTTSSITVSLAGNYSVSVSNGTCTSLPSDIIPVTSVSTPAKPTISFVGREFICSGAVVALTAPINFNHYKWSTGEITQTILIDKSGNYSVQVGLSANCLSLASDLKEVVLGTPVQCGITPSITNKAPVIRSFSFAVQINSTITYSLIDLISDENNNLDLKTLEAVNQPNLNGKESGGKAQVDSEGVLSLDYTGRNFAGKEYITLQVCDTDGICTQKDMLVDVVGDVVVFNGLTPDGDGINDFIRIQFIDVLEAGSKNTVVILNRWGDKVFEMTDYNNKDRVFAGNGSNGNELPSGTYLYRVELSNGKKYTGFITLKRL